MANVTDIHNFDDQFQYQLQKLDDADIDDRDRCLYAVTTYKDEGATRTERPCTYDRDEGATVWKSGDNPMSGYGDLRAVPVWGDVDLRDAIKPERDDLDENTCETIEVTLEQENRNDEQNLTRNGLQIILSEDETGAVFC